MNSFSGKKKSVRSKFLNLKIVRILFLTDLRLLAMHQFLTGNLDLITIWRIRQNPSSGVTIFSEMGMASSPVDHSETCALSSVVQSLEIMVQVCSKLLCYLYIFLQIYLYFINETFPSDDITSMIEMHNSFHKINLKSQSIIPNFCGLFII